MMHAKLLLSLLFPIFILSMEENNSGMSQIRNMEDVRYFLGEFLACKPRTKLGESLVSSGWEQVNFCLINPNLDTYWHREIRREEKYYYFHVLNKFGTAILTRVISEKTLKEEPLSCRLATQEEKEHILASLHGKFGGVYTMEFSGRSEYQECCFTTKRLIPSNKELQNAFKKNESGLGIKRYEHEELFKDSVSKQ